MFYSQEILQRRGGKFGVVWLAATRAAALTKKDYYSVHVAKICDDLLKHITLRVFQHGSKQRFSLYLSSQLMFGIAKVYGKQADYLLIEVQRLHRQFSSTRLMLAEYMEDDLFQLPRIPRSMGAQTLPSPDLGQFSGELRMELISHPHFFEEEYISSRSVRELEMSLKSPDRPLSPIPDLQDLSDIQPHVVSNIDEITLKEDIGVTPIEFQVTEGDDFGGMMAQGMEATLAEVPLPTEEEFMVYDQPITTPPKEEKMWTVEEGTGKLVLSPSQEKKTKRTRKTRAPEEPATPEEAVIEGRVPSPLQVRGVTKEKESSDEGPQPEFKTPQSPSGQAVDVPILRLAAIREQEVTPPYRRGSGRKRRRQLLFVDLKTQLSKTEMRSNMADFESLLEKDILANPDPIPTAKELFSEPARKAAKMSEILVDLWREGTNVAPRPEEDQDTVWSLDYLRAPEIEGSSSEYDLPEVPKLGMSDVEMLEQLRAAEASRAEESRVSSKMEDTPASLNITDTSRLSQSREGSRQGSFITEPGLPRMRMEEGIIEEENLLGAAALPELPEAPAIPETEEFVAPEVPLPPEEGVQVDMDFSRPPELSASSEDEERGDVPHRQVFQKISELASEENATTFQELVPLSTDRKIAAKIFSICLGYAKKGLIELQQSRPYADIVIYPTQREA